MGKSEGNGGTLKQAGSNVGEGLRSWQNTQASRRQCRGRSEGNGGTLKQAGGNVGEGLKVMTEHSSKQEAM